MECTFTDLHTHILPGVDDGAKNMEKALEMLRMQKACGVDRVALTPHFYPLREEFQAFLEKRQLAYEALLPNWDRETMPELRLAAEVHYSPTLSELDMRRLTIGESNYLLLELSNTSFPAHIESILKAIQQQGIVPILAHVERCEYFMEEPDRLVQLVKLGAMAQVSTKAMVEKKRRKFVQVCLQKSVAQIVASDIHDLWEKKYLVGNVVSKANEKMITRAEEFAKAVWDNVLPPAYTVDPVKRTLFGYR
ncbi:MAG: capsular biosynthesis protein [Oscillospiraceae bacterium]|nr:capsular biosynthesis protein [Oscillospiraceae bacterium]